MLGRLQRPPRKGEAAGSAVCVWGGGEQESPPHFPSAGAEQGCLCWWPPERRNCQPRAQPGFSPVPNSSFAIHRVGRG